MANIDELYRLCLEDKNGDINRYLGGWDTSSSDSEDEEKAEKETKDSEDSEDSEDESIVAEEKADESIVAENQEAENQEAENQEVENQEVENQEVENQEVEIVDENQVDKLGGDDKPILPPSEEEEMRGAKESLIEKMNKIFKKNRS